MLFLPLSRLPPPFFPAALDLYLSMPHLPASPHTSKSPASVSASLSLTCTGCCLCLPYLLTLHHWFGIEFSWRENAATFLHGWTHRGGSSSVLPVFVEKGLDVPHRGVFLFKKCSKTDPGWEPRQLFIWLNTCLVWPRYSSGKQKELIHKQSSFVLSACVRLMQFLWCNTI